MVVKMMKWYPWQQPAPATETRKFQVKVMEMKVEGFNDNREGDGGRREKVMAVKVIWKGERRQLGLVAFHRRHREYYDSRERNVRKGEAIVWEDEFENVCSFSVVSSSGGEYKFLPWDVSFKLSYGDYHKGKLGVIGKASLNLAEIVSAMESPVVETTLPINLEVAGGFSEATISVVLSLVEIRGSQDSPQLIQNWVELEDVVGNGKKEKKKQLSVEEVSLYDSDESVTFDSARSPNLQMDPVKRVGFFNWKRRRLSLKPVQMKAEPSIMKMSEHVEGQRVDFDASSFSVDSITSLSGPIQKESSRQLYEPNKQEESTTSGKWETKELTSRDGQSKLETEVFFASFDQRSEKAAGESACTVLVAVIAHWLQSNRDAMPTRSEFDNLIIDGSLEWRRLCNHEAAYVQDFPNKHFDLETVLRAGLRPVSVSREKSFVGFFGPEKFECLKEAMSFESIWDEISRNQEENEPRVYIVSWNDHFFVLKADANAYYVIDTLGERLFEGCDQAFILRFDDSSLMQGKTEVICRGKECCREFIKKFLAAIPLGELEMEEEKETVPYFSLHHRLQIEFNFCTMLV